MENLKLILSLLFFVFFVSCDSNDYNKELNSNYIVLNTEDSTENIYYSFKSTDKVYNVEFNRGNILFSQNYEFDNRGNLIEKRGKNFFGEEEVYFFDSNNSLAEFRKNIFFNKKKKGLQEYITYKSGLIDENNSHFFVFTITDSTKNEYNVNLKYIGNRKLEKIKVVVGTFEMYADKINFASSDFEFNGSDCSFWVKKNVIYDSELEFYQVNLLCKFRHDSISKARIKRSNKKDYYEQVFILRRLKVDIL